MLSALMSGSPPVLAPSSIVSIRRHSFDDTKPRGGSRAAEVLKPREFTSADKALIRKVHGYMVPQQLLQILNERLISDIGAGVALYTLDQLKAEIAGVSAAMPPIPVGGNDWGSLRKLLATAKRTGVLAQIDEQVINDFAVVYSLNQKQVMSLKDILLNEEDE